MKIFAEYHSHSRYSDGKASIAEMVEQASKLGYEIFGISDHGYRHHFFGVSYDAYPRMREEIDRLQEQYPNMKLLLGVEANILDDKGNIDVDDYILSHVDYVMAGYHFGSIAPDVRGLRNHVNNYCRLFSHREIDYNTDALIRAMKNNDLFILTHPGDKGRIHTVDVAKAAAQTGTVLEINVRHGRLSLEQLKEIRNINVKYAIGTDAHRPEHLAWVEPAIERAEQAGVDSSSIINVKGADER